jgi:hypothetical protein
MVMFVIVDYQCHRHQWQITTVIVDINGIFAVSVTAISVCLGKGENTSVVDPPAVNLPPVSPLNCLMSIFANFRKKSKWI